MLNPTAPARVIPTPPVIGEVRYSLPQLLKELEIERAAGSFAMEKLDQAEITKMFKAHTRRAKSKK